MVINNKPPRLTWQQASQIFDRSVHNTVERNNDHIRSLIEDIRKQRKSMPSQKTREWMREQLYSAKLLRANNRELLGCYNAMMRGV